MEAVVYGVKVPNTEGRAGMVSIVVESASHFNPKRFYQQIKENASRLRRAIICALVRPTRKGPARTKW